MTDMFWDDKPHEECGIFGIFAPGRDVGRITFFGLYALQHRGQESAGIATCDGRVSHVHKDMGLVAQVFNEQNLAPLVGTHAIGHTRYSTTGSSHVRNCAPYLIETMYGALGVAHNGNLTNTLQLRRKLLERGVGLSSTTDSEVVTQMLAAPASTWREDEQSDDYETLSNESPGANASGNNNASPDRRRWEARLRAFMQVAEGAYSLTVLTRDAIYGVRDALGLRPLCIGELENGGWVLASETCALHTVGATFVREVQPGEIVRLDNDGLHSIKGHARMPRALCSFEYVYFARPDSVMEGQVIHEVRQRLGRELAKESPVEADVVIAVPDSATPHAIGYSLQSGIPFSEGLIKNRYIGRTFIQPDDDLRKAGVKLKYNPLTTNLKGRRVILIDDSIVRGNTSGPIVQLLRDAGATEVHVRVASPAVRHPCFMGVDMATYNELIAHKMAVSAICEKIGSDSLAYLSIEGLNKAIREGVQGETGHCNACFSGIYPINIPEWLFRDDRATLVFEAMWG